MQASLGRPATPPFNSSSARLILCHRAALLAGRANQFTGGSTKASQQELNTSRISQMSNLKVPKRPLGQTGLEVSVLGFGASALGGVFEAIREEDGIQAVHDAFAAGINFFDTSPFYGITKSETVLGMGLKDLPRAEVVLATKVGRYGPADFDFSPERVTASVHESLQRLQTSYIDVIQCHDIEFGSLDQVIYETLPALQKLKQEGLVRHIGITGLPFKIFSYVLDRVPPGTVDTVLSYCHYTLYDLSLQAQLPYFKSKNVGIINASPLGMGLLTNLGPPAWHPAPEELKSACQRAAQHCTSKGVDIAKLAIANAISDPDLCSTLVSMATPDLVRCNVQWTLEATGLLPNPQADHERHVNWEVQEMFKPVSDTTWASGRPENN